MFGIRRSIFSAVVVFSGAAFAGTDPHAQDLANGWKPNALEIAQLPDYCQRFFLTRALPPNCDGVHHLCAGKVLIGRAMNFSIPKTERKRILRGAKNEVDYIFTRKNPSCKMMDAARLTQRQIGAMEPQLR